MAINPMTGNSFRFDWLVSYRNTINEIRSAWNVPNAVAEDMQHLIACNEKESTIKLIAKASNELRQQVGF